MEYGEEWMLLCEVLDEIQDIESDNEINFNTVWKCSLASFSQDFYLTVWST